MKPLYQIPQNVQDEFARSQLIVRAIQVYMEHEGFDGEVEYPDTYEKAVHILKWMGELDK